MGKRLLACLVCLALFAFSAVPAGADSESVLWELRGCSAVYAYSGKRAAYFFGFNGASLVSSRIFPDTVTRSAEAGGSIVLACHDESAAYALYRAGIGGYRALIMDMNSGACEDVAVAQGCAVQASSFAAADFFFAFLLITATIETRRTAATSSYASSLSIASKSLNSTTLVS